MAFQCRKWLQACNHFKKQRRSGDRPPLAMGVFIEMKYHPKTSLTKKSMGTSHSESRSRMGFEVGF